MCISQWTWDDLFWLNITVASVWVDDGCMEPDSLTMHLLILRPSNFSTSFLMKISRHFSVRYCVLLMLMMLAMLLVEAWCCCLLLPMLAAASCWCYCPCLLHMLVLMLLILFVFSVNWSNVTMHPWIHLLACLHSSLFIFGCCSWIHLQYSFFLTFILTKNMSIRFFPHH